MSRTSKSIRNIKYALLGQSIALITTFFARMIFVRILSAEYLGINGLFTNLLSLLSFAELGIGASIIFSLYKPIAEKNESQIKALMHLYKKSYIIIGLVIAMISLAFTPFLNVIFKSKVDIPNLQVIYLMFVMNTVISYFFTYKRSLIIADQKSYINTLYHYFFYVALNMAQILILVLTKSYILFLLLQIISTLLENLLISNRVNKLYPFLKSGSIVRLDKNEKNTIVRNVKAMMCHKIGTVLVLGTDSLLLSKLVSVVSVGMYSNYLMITKALNTLFGLIFQAITASVGNLGVMESNKKREFIFNCVDLVGFWIYAFASISLINLFNPFIRLWLGETYLFSMSLVLIIIINFYMTGRRKSVLTFKDAFGLFWYDRYKSLYEAGVNLTVSIILGKLIGVAGIFIGTMISTITVCFWVEPYVLYKHGFICSVKPYFIKYILYTSLMFIVGSVTWLLCSLFSDVTLIGFISKVVVCTFIPNILFSILFWKTKEFQYLLNIVKPLLLKS